MTTNENRINRMFDNDINRVVERARRSGITPVGWQVVDTNAGWTVFYVNDTTPYERGNNGRYLFTPIFEPEEANINGYAL
jgi:hypothetical protein